MANFQRHRFIRPYLYTYIYIEKKAKFDTSKHKIAHRSLAAAGDVNKRHVFPAVCIL